MAIGAADLPFLAERASWRSRVESRRLPSNAGRQRAPKMNMANAMPGINASFYANRTINQMLDIQAMNKSNLHLKVDNEEGNQKLTLRGIPIRTVDALTEAEAQVT